MFSTITTVAKAIRVAAVRLHEHYVKSDKNKLRSAIFNGFLFVFILSIPVLSFLESCQQKKEKRRQEAEHTAFVVAGLQKAPVESVAVFDVDSVYAYFASNPAQEMLTTDVVNPLGYCFFKTFEDSFVALPSSKQCSDRTMESIRENYPMKLVEFSWSGDRDTTVKLLRKISTLNRTSYEIKEDDTVTNLPRYVCMRELGSILGVRRPINYQELEACQESVVYSSTYDTVVTNAPDSSITITAHPVVLFNAANNSGALRGRVGMNHDLLVIANFKIRLENKIAMFENADTVTAPVANMTNQKASWRIYSIERSASSWEEAIAE